MMAKIPMRIGMKMGTNAYKNLCVIEFEHNNIYGQNVANTSLLAVRATLKLTSALSSELEGRRLELFSLSGDLRYGALHVPMRPLLSFGYAGINDTGTTISLEFELTASQVEYLEQRRLYAGARADVELDVKLQGRVLVVSNWGSAQETVRFETLEPDIQGSSYGSIRIARSDWHERILPRLGYNETLLIELPLPEYGGALDQVVEAVDKLEAARQHLLDENYREAVHFCREAKDALTKRDPNELTNLLEPLIGTTKASTVNGVLLAFGRMYTASSHPATLPNAERIEFTYEDAKFAVNSMAFVLDYVAQALKTQGLEDEDEDDA